MKRTLLTKIMLLLYALIAGSSTLWADDTVTLASWTYTSDSKPANKTNFNATGGSCTSSTFYLNGSGSAWNSTNGYAFTSVTDITITLKTTIALPVGTELSFSADIFYKSASNAPMTGFNLTASENGGSYSTTGLDVTSFSLSNSSATKTCVYTLQSALAVDGTVAIKYTQTGKAGSGQGYFNNIVINVPEIVAAPTPSITANDVNIASNATSGSIGYTLANGTGNVTASRTGDWLTLGTITASEVPFTCSANPGTTARTATVTLSFEGAEDKVITVTQAAPFTIASAGDWETFCTNVAGGNTYSGQTVKMTANITTSVRMNGTFSGIFDGGGNTLNVTISEDNTQYLAPFRTISGATIKNLTVTGSVATGTDHVAGLVGEVTGENNRIENCVVNSNVSLNGYGGGVVGELTGALTIKDVIYNGTITQENSAYKTGGFIGYYDGDNMNLAMNNCMFNGTYVGSYFHPIGIKNPNNDFGTLSCINCFYTTTPANTTGGDVIPAEATKASQLTLNPGISILSGSYCSFGNEVYYYGTVTLGYIVPEANVTYYLDGTQLSGNSFTISQENAMFNDGSATITVSPSVVAYGNCGTTGHESEVTWVLTGTSPNYTLIISGAGPMADYSSSDQPWYSYRTSIASVVINSGVTHIGNNSFYHCTSLTSTTLPSSGLSSIGNCAFRLCSSLASINIPDGLTTIGTQAFERCKISSINIPSSVTNIGFQALLNCSSLSNITVDSGNDYYLSEDGALFDKDKTKIIQYPIAKSGDTYTLPATVTEIYDQAFRYCTNLTSFNVPDGVTTIGGNAFNGCTNLSSVTISNSVTSIGASAFSGCTKLSSVTLNSNPSISTSAFPSGATVTMNLAANKAAEGEYWTTFYNRNYNFEAASGTQIFKAALSGTKLTLTELGDDSGEDKIVTKNKAVILKSTTSPMVFTLTTSDSGNDYDTDNSLLGVSSASGLTANGTHFVLNKGSNGVGFYRMTSGKVIGVGKAYLTYSGALAREFFGFEETTGIDEVSSTKIHVSSDDIFDLQGRRVEHPTKGLYIVNGKKTAIK